MKKFFSTMLIAFLCAGALLAQDRAQKVVAIKNGNRNGILHTLQELAPTNGMVISTSDNDHIILSGPKETIAGFEEIIKQLDVPPVIKKNIETTVYMIAASMQSGNGTPLIAELDPVAKQLKTIFNYKTLNVLESFVLRSRDGDGGETSGLVLSEGSPGLYKMRYVFRYRHVSLDGTDTQKSVRLDGLQLLLKVPVGPAQTSFEDTGISTDVDVPEGKKVVVGKTSGVLGPDSALILVISAKVVD
jgi:hypothetical protein